jgi:hypothetical protein
MPAKDERLMKLSGILAITIFCVFGITSGFAAPIERAVGSAECKGIIARLLEATNASFDHYSPSGDTVFLRVCPETSGRIAKFSEHEAN